MKSSITIGLDDEARELLAVLKRRDVAGELVRYARHQNACNTQKHPAEGGDYSCTCGLAELLEKARGA